MVKKLRNEILQLGLLFIILIIIFKIIFFNEDLLVVLKVVAGFFFTFLIPGFSMMYYWHEKLDFLERLIIGIVLGMAVFGIVSYYTGLLGFNLRYQSIILPIAFTLAAIIFNYYILKKK